MEGGASHPKNGGPQFIVLLGMVKRPGGRILEGWRHGLDPCDAARRSCERPGGQVGRRWSSTRPGRPTLQGAIGVDDECQPDKSLPRKETEGRRVMGESAM
jgi:hypothetical protein